MITTQEHTGFIKVEEYSLDAWLSEVETVIKQGYTFDFKSNETFPQAFGSMYTVLMVPSKDKPQSATTSVLTVQVDTTEVRALIDEKISEVKAMQEATNKPLVKSAMSDADILELVMKSDITINGATPVASVTHKVDGRKKK